MFNKYTSKLETIECKQENTETECLHLNVLIWNDSNLCGDCGLEITENNTTDYNSKSFSDPTRCYIRKEKDKTIYQDLQHLNISKRIKDIANNIYVEACKSKVKRATNRKGVVFASVFQAYKLDNNPQSFETLLQLFKIKPKSASNGVKFISENISKDSPIHTNYITPKHRILDFLQKFSVSEEKRTEILELYALVENRSSLINRSKPQSVAAGILWAWLSMNNANISIKEFIRKVGLSELTVNKISKEVIRVVNKK